MLPGLHFLPGECKNAHISYLILDPYLKLPWNNWKYGKHFSQGMQYFTHKLWLKSETNVKFTGKKVGEEEGEEEEGAGEKGNTK